MALGKHNVRVQACWRDASRARSATRWSRRSSPTCPEGSDRPADRPHALRRHDQRFPTPRSRAMLEYAARSLRAGTAFATSSSSATTAATRRAEASVAAAARPRMGAASPVRVHALAEYYRVDRARVRAGAEGSAASRDAEIGTHAGLADTSLALAVDPRLVRSDAAARRQRARRGATACTAIRAARAPSSGQVGVDLDRRAHRVAAIRARASARR